MKKNEQSAIEHLLDALEEQANSLSIDELKAELCDRGIDPENFIKNTLSIIDTAKKEDRLSWMKVAKEKKKALMETGVDFVSWLTRKPSEIEEAFTAVFAEAPVAFRNKGTLSLEDKARLLDDHEKLKRKTGNQNKSETT